MSERALATLATLLHNEFCKDPSCNGVSDYMDAARRLLPKIEKYVVDRKGA